VFVGFNDYTAGGIVELTRSWDFDGAYSHGSGYGHISIGVPDIVAMIAKLETMGMEITMRPKPLIAGGPRVAFVKDPDGYAVELIQTHRDNGG
jgi:lactoylglutathione lyase